MRLAACALLAALVVAGCQSTQSKSAELKAHSKGALAAGKGVVVKKENPHVKVIATSTLKDKNGEAVVVHMRNTGKKPLANLPISVRLADRSGKSVYTNTTPGLEAALAHIALLGPGQELYWVNDQVVSSGRPAQAKTLVGASAPVDGAVPKVAVKKVHLLDDPVSGISALGHVVNHSKILQRRLPVFCVARHGDAIVAAGRAILEKVKPDKSASFQTFFIGNPRGARITCTPLPSTLKGTAS
jgi:hypothetical protein